MDFTRNLKKGTSGEDVLFCKQKLLELGFYGDHITTVTKKTFGADTLEAVKRFQSQAGLTVDGIIGKETWAALFGDTATEAEPITKATATDKTNAICALALTRIGDLYVWGGSGMTDLSDSAIQAKDENTRGRSHFGTSSINTVFPTCWVTIARGSYPGSCAKRVFGIRGKIAMGYGHSAKWFPVMS